MGREGAPGHVPVDIPTFQCHEKQDTARVKKKKLRKSNYEGMATASDRKNQERVLSQKLMRKNVSRGNECPPASNAAEKSGNTKYFALFCKVTVIGNFSEQF